MQEDSLPAEPQGKPKITGMGSLSLLQGIFLTQESNWGLPDYRRILYELSCQENVYITKPDFNKNFLLLGLFVKNFLFTLFFKSFFTNTVLCFNCIKLIHRNPLHSYALTMRKQKEKLRKQSHSPLQ